MKRTGWRRRFGHRDRNHSAIAKALTRLGLSVLDLSPLGDGAPDMLVGWNGFDALFELKVPGGKPKPHQAMWHRGWRGRPVRVATSLDGVLEAMGFPLRRSITNASGADVPPRT